MSSNKPEYHKINVLLIPNVAWTNGLGPVPACATCFRQCPLYTFRERLFPTDLRLLDWGVAVGGGVGRGDKARLHPASEAAPGGSWQLQGEGGGQGSLHGGSCDQLWLPGVGAQVHSRRKTAGVGVRCVPHPSPTWSSSSTPAPSSPCASLGGPCFLGVLAHSHCHGTHNRHLFLTVWRLDVRDLGTGRWFLLRPLSLVC